MRPYKVTISGDPGNKYCIDGPGVGFGYHSHLMWPHRQFEDKQFASYIVTMCNDAYTEGYQKARQDIRNSLGID